MKHCGFVTMIMVVAVGLLGLAPVAVCEMPPECPMQQPSGHHVCCQPPGPSTNGMAGAPCHPVHPAAAPASPTSVPHHSAALLFSTVVALEVPTVFVGPSPVVTLVAAVPRFLLTHAFRL